VTLSYSFALPILSDLLLLLLLFFFFFFFFFFSCLSTFLLSKFYFNPVLLIIYPSFSHIINSQEYRPYAP